MINGVQPELSAFPVYASYWPQLFATYISPGLFVSTAANNTLYVKWDSSTKGLSIRPYSRSYFGPELDCSAGDAIVDGVVYADDDSGYIKVNVPALTGSWTNSNYAVGTLSTPKQTFIPDVEGYETGIGTFPKYRYHALAAANNGNDLMVQMSAMTEKPYILSSTQTSGNTYITSDYTSITLNNISAWPTSSFWIRNTNLATENGPIRYVRYRNGNNLVCSNWFSGMRGTGTNYAYWSSGHTIEVCCDIDVGIEYPNEVGSFQTPANEYTAPTGVTFYPADDQSRMADGGDVSPGGRRMIWVRETFVTGHRVRKDVNGNVKVLWS
jgi:hypothetical protein